MKRTNKAYIEFVWYLFQYLDNAIDRLPSVKRSRLHQVWREMEESIFCHLSFEKRYLFIHTFLFSFSLFPVILLSRISKIRKLTKKNGCMLLYHSLAVHKCVFTKCAELCYMIYLKRAQVRRYVLNFLKSQFWIQSHRAYFQEEIWYKFWMRFC